MKLTAHVPPRGQLRPTMKCSHRRVKNYDPRPLPFMMHFFTSLAHPQQTAVPKNHQWQRRKLDLPIVTVIGPAGATIRGGCAVEPIGPPVQKWKKTPVTSMVMWSTSILLSRRYGNQAAEQKACPAPVELEWSSKHPAPPGVRQFPKPLIEASRISCLA